MEPYGGGLFNINATIKRQRPLRCSILGGIHMKECRNLAGRFSARYLDFDNIAALPQLCSAYMPLYALEGETETQMPDLAPDL